MFEVHSGIEQYNRIHFAKLLLATHTLMDLKVSERCQLHRVVNAGVADRNGAVGKKGTQQRHKGCVSAALKPHLSIWRFCFHVAFVFLFCFPYSRDTGVNQRQKTELTNINLL